MRMRLRVGRMTLNCWEQAREHIRELQEIRDSFRWPRKGDATWHLTPDEFHWLVCGVDWQQVKRHDLAKWVYQEEPEDAQSNAITQ